MPPWPSRRISSYCAIRVPASSTLPKLPLEQAAVHRLGLVELHCRVALGARDRRHHRDRVAGLDLDELELLVATRRAEVRHVERHHLRARAHEVRDHADLLHDHWRATLDDELDARGLAALDE